MLANRKRKKINIHAKKMSFLADTKIQFVSNVLVRSVNLSNVFSVHNNWYSVLFSLRIAVQSLATLYLFAIDE